MQNQCQPSRRRTIWTDAEVEILVAAFKKNDKPTRSEVTFLIGILNSGRTEKQVRNWFMNQRSKAKKMKRDKEAFLSQSNLSVKSESPTQFPPTQFSPMQVASTLTPYTRPTPIPALKSPIMPTQIVKNDLEWPVFPDLSNPFNDLNLLAYHQAAFQPFPYFYNVQLNGFGQN